MAVSMDCEILWMMKTESYDNGAERRKIVLWASTAHYPMGHSAGGGAAGVIVPLTDSGHFLAFNYCCSFAYGLALSF